MRQYRVATWLCAASLTFFAISSASSQNVQSFYEGQNISMTIGSGVGGGYDAVARVVARHIGKYIPGTPNVVPRNMPGAGGLTHLNYIYNSAAKDGSVIGAPFNTALILPILKDPAAKFDPREFSWIGSTDKQQGICITWGPVPVRTIRDAQTREVLAGTTAPNATPSTYPFLLNSVLDTKFKIIGGYTTSGLRLALERGEVESICGMAIQTHLAVNPHWFSDRLVNVLVQFGMRKHKSLPDVPLATDLLKNEDDRKLLQFILIPHEFGRPFLAPPGIPSARRNALQAAFEKMLSDPDFLAESARSKQGVEPLSAREIESLLAQAYATPPRLIDAAAKILRGPEFGK